MMKTKRVLIGILYLLTFASLDISAQTASLVAPEKVCIGSDIVLNFFGTKNPSCIAEADYYLTIKSPDGNSTGRIPVPADGTEFTFPAMMDGQYEITYEVEDDGGCPVGGIASESKTVTVLALPTAEDASFTQEELIVCQGNTAILELNMNANTHQAVVSDSIGVVTFPTEGNTFVITDPLVNPRNVFYISRITELDIGCETSVNIGAGQTPLDSIVVFTVPIPEVDNMATSVSCDPTATMVQEAKFGIRGGEGSYSIVSGPANIVGDTLIVSGVGTEEEFTVVLNTGMACGDIVFTASAACACPTKAGEMDDEPISLCKDGTAIAIHDGLEDLRSGVDQLFYVLHTSADDTLRDIPPLALNRSEPVFNFDPETMQLDVDYFISAFACPFDGEEPLYYNSSCFDMSRGVRVKWLPGNNFNVIGDNEVCINENNVAFTAEIQGELIGGTTTSWSSVGNASLIGSTGDNSTRGFFDFQGASPGDEASIIFQSEVQIQGVNGTCVDTDTVTVKVSEDPSRIAPEQTEIYLWPGNIFAATQNDVCYQWGFYDGLKQSDSVLVGENSKYFFASDALVNAVPPPVIWVATYFDNGGNCDFSFENCNAISYFSADIPPGLNEGVADNFSASINPTPNNGFFRLDLKGDYRGIYKAEIRNSIGQRMKAIEIDKQYVRSFTDINLEGAEAGIYFITLTNENGERRILKTIISN